MQIGVLSDAHGNSSALETALAALRGHVEEIFFAGDAFSDHHFDNEAVELLRHASARWVLGNHELNFLSPAGTPARCASHVRPDTLDYVRLLPTRIDCRTGGWEILMVHGSPWPPFGEYLAPGCPRLGQAESLGIDLLILGHTHLPEIARYGRTLVVNPGSVGRPERPGAPDLASYAVVDTARGTAEIIDFSLPG